MANFSERSEMMLSLILNVILIAISGWVLLNAWLANRRTTLRHALCWTVAAWAAWAATVAADAAAVPANPDSLRYVALSLTGCAGVAVLGARRPGVGAGTS